MRETTNSRDDTLHFIVKNQTLNEIRDDTLHFFSKNQTLGEIFLYPSSEVLF